LSSLPRKRGGKKTNNRSQKKATLKKDLASKEGKTVGIEKISPPNLSQKKGPKKPNTGEEKGGYAGNRGKEKNVRPV